MLKSRLYKKYFPVKGVETKFTEKEKQILCHWALRFPMEMVLREQEKAQQGFKFVSSYNMDDYKEKTIISMIKENRFDEINLIYLNFILYRHKYNDFLSIWTFPMLTKAKAMSLWKED